MKKISVRSKKKQPSILAILLLGTLLAASLGVIWVSSRNNEPIEETVQEPSEWTATDNPVEPTLPKIQFKAEISKVSAEQKTKMISTGSWRTGCPVAISDLRVLTLTHWGFDGSTHQGELMVHADVAEDVKLVFKKLFDTKYLVHRMELVEAYGASDLKSMQADNTSGFNCRIVPGSSTWSQHAYGRAIDLNPFENPEVRNGNIDPPQAARYADRTLSDRGMIRPNDAAVKAFESIGWSWGGDWDSPKDYQHFSLSGT